MIGSGILSGLIYWFTIVHPVWLFDNIRVPLINLYHLNLADNGLRWRMLAGFVGLSVLYGIACWAAYNIRGKSGWVILWAGFALFAGLLLFVYPFEAADIFDNIVHGRIISVYGENPFINVGSNYTKDPFFDYMGWKDYPTAYGPAWEILAGWVTRLTGNDKIVNVLAFKLFPGLFVLISAVALASIAKKEDNRSGLIAAVFIAWNPIILFETFGMGHNDSTILAALVLSAWAIQHRRHSLAVWMLVAGGMFKFIPLLAAPVALVVGLRSLKTRREQIRYVFITGGIAAAIIVILYAPFFTSFQVFEIAQRASQFTTSLPTILVQIISKWVGNSRAEQIIGAIALIATLQACLWQMLIVWKDTSLRAYARACTNLFLFFLLVSCTWFHQWYVIWFLGVAFLAGGQTLELAIFFCFASLTKPFIFGPMFYWPPMRIPLPWLEIWLSTGVMAPTWLYFIIRKITSRASKPASIHLSNQSLPK